MEVRKGIDVSIVASFAEFTLFVTPYPKPFFTALKDGHPYLPFISLFFLIECG